jgi:hypothetical protein
VSDVKFATLLPEWDVEPILSGRRSWVAIKPAPHTPLRVGDWLTLCWYRFGVAEQQRQDVKITDMFRESDRPDLLIVSFAPIPNIDHDGAIIVTMTCPLPAATLIATLTAWTDAWPTMNVDVAEGRIIGIVPTTGGPS